MSKSPAPSLVRNQPLPEGTPHVPVVIVGAGACGLTTAIRLRDAGMDCVLLERDQVPQGSTALSSGFIPAAGTRLQQSKGIEDSQALFAEDVVAKTHGEAAPHLVQAYTRAVPQAIDSLEAHGIVFEVLEGFLYPGHRALRMHAVPQRTGAALVAALERTATAAGADILTEALVRELWLDGDRIAGIGYVRPDGGMEHIACDEVVLACNGFGGNQEMVRELLPEMANADYGGHVGNDGTAIAWGKQLGARLADLRAYQGHGSWVIPQGALMTWAVIMEGGVQINGEGKRFHDETHGYSEAAVHVLHQPGRVAWNVFDEPLLALARTFPDFVEAEKAGALRTAQNEDELAKLLGCDPRALRETLAGVAAGRTDAFGRSFKRALAAPFHAVKVTGALFHTQGGLDIDEQCRVLRTDGTPLPNLVAAGGAARGVSGNDVSGYLSGNGLLSAVGGGWVAAGTVIDRLKA
ncbi:FAD-dependent oxidoreductase [Ramlibacter sp. G-1-2-2]|uniref:FAD-dependent oxidoreductase n=1 Tax=Ramlibacter agri TaxID=2728837 RepID=A0A848HC14_9BURK|nr:FAD-dependent oxidoreductase [Ramlibacter agri]NML48014.1 FAD-dependent oxidoreductase [Ramlibacter agri]